MLRRHAPGAHREAARPRAGAAAYPVGVSDPRDARGESWGEQGDPGHSEPLEPHLWHTRLRMPDEHRRIGLDARTEEGALVEFASSLDARRPVHRAVAWVLLAVFAVPALASLARLLGELLGTA